MKTHTLNVRIYYEDTDAGGIVYHANYLNFGERARCELLRELDLECSKLVEKAGLMFVVKHADIEYIRPAVLDDALQVLTTVERMKNTSFVVRHIVQKDGENICEMHVTLVCIDANSFKPISMPETIRSGFEPYLEG